MYCLKCRRVKETENITTAAAKNGRLVSASHVVKLTLNLLKEELLVEVF